MVKVNEVRLGNWVMTADGPGKVSIIEGCYDTAEFRGIVSDNKHDVWVRVLDNDDPIDPIPLTPEILEKCGFESTYFGFRIFYDTGVFHLHNNFQPFMNCTDDTIEYGEPLKYLHQLQNLYFAITNKELEIAL